MVTLGVHDNTQIVKEKYDYTQAELIQAIRNVGIQERDVVSLQVSLGRLGYMKAGWDIKNLSHLVIEAFLQVLSPEGTLLVPTYTYSIGKGEIYEVERTSSVIGDFTEIFRARKDVIRSRDPMLSTAGLGSAAKRILREISFSCYGKGSTFDNICAENGKICTLGIGIYWATFRHYIEESAAVPFRFLKEFKGIVKEGGIEKEENWSYFAAPQGLENCQPNGIPLENILTKKGLIREQKVGKGTIKSIGAKNYLSIGLDELKKNPWLTAKGPPTEFSKKGGLLAV